MLVGIKGNNMPSIFFIGDTHFGHKNIIKFEPELRPFVTIEEHNEYIISQWNKTVGPKDTVWHLGDVLFGKETFNLDLIDRLNGHKKLVLGNHDDFPNQYLERFILPRFDKICGVGQVHGFVLTHIPIAETYLGRYKGNIHGHTRSRNLDDPRYINVSCEQIGLTPISYEDLMQNKYRLGNKEG